MIPSPNMSQMNSARPSQPQSGPTSMTAFDNLLSMPSHRKPVPMNQMMNTSMGKPPAVPSMTPNVSISSYNSTMIPQKVGNSNSNVSGSNKLSKDDLLDFLG